MLKRQTALLLLFLLLMGMIPAPAETRTDIPTADFSKKFAGKFLAEDEPEAITDFSYKSRDLSIEITTYREEKSDIYVADIYVRSLSSLRRGFGGGKWNGKMQRVVDIALQEGAILALTGDNGHNFNKGIVYENGVRHRRTKNNARDLCVIFDDGEMVIYKGSEVTLKKLEATGKAVWQTFLFGPGLLSAQGKALTRFRSSVAGENPRAAIGYYEPGHYCLVQVDGRGVKSALEKGKRCTGFTLQQLAKFMEKLGCAAAYNLDGGQSALMWFNGRIVSTPYKNGRTVGDVVYILRTAAK